MSEKYDDFGFATIKKDAIIAIAYPKANCDSMGRAYSYKVTVYLISGGQIDQFFQKKEEADGFYMELQVDLGVE